MYLLHYFDILKANKIELLNNIMIDTLPHVRSILINNLDN